MVCKFSGKYDETAECLYIAEDTLKMAKHIKCEGREEDKKECPLWNKI